MSHPATHHPIPAPARTLSVAAIAVAALLAAPSADAAEERFRLAPGSVMQNDGAALDGTFGHARGLGYEVVQGYAVAEGDMVLGRVDESGRLEIPFRPRGLGQRAAFDRWPDGIVPYAFHPGLSEIQERNIEEALERLNAKTRIALVPVDAPEAEGYDDYILFEPSRGCASYVGRQLSTDAQSLWVADSCSVGSIVHEISHAIGLFHEHTRPDRDNHVTIVWDEIIEDKAFNFEIYDEGAESWGEYDYGSIMHYGEYYFSKSRSRRTIVAPDDVDIGQRVELSANDIETIDRMYATDLAVDASVHASERGLEIDVSVTNNGTLGARGLTLRAIGKPGTDWTSVSAESGWDCLAYEEELRCERARLIEQASSRFTIVADPATVSASDISYTLESITLDTDPSNNGEALEDEPEALDSSTDDVAVEPDAPAAALPASVAPGTTTALNAFGARSATDDGADDAGSGGGASGLAPLALLGAIALRRRRRHR